MPRPQPSNIIACLLISLAVACGSSSENQPVTRPPPLDGAISALVFSRTQGFRHDSIGAATRFFSSLDPREGFDVTLTEDPSVFTDEGLARFEVVVFANTTGDVLDDEQQAAFERYLRAGKGFVGIHAAADTEHDWPFYRDLLGALFVSHPEIPVEVGVTVEQGLHPATAHLSPAFQFTDEWYNFDRNPRADSDVLLTIDESGFTVPNTPPGPSMGADHPVAWSRDVEGARVFYTNLGHRPETWQNPVFQRHVLEGMRFAARDGGYGRAVLTRSLKNPLAIAVTPQNDVYVIERTGEVLLYSSKTGWLLEATKLDVDTTQENGLLGIALDPEFATNRYVYLYYSEPLGDAVPETGPPGRNVLARFRAAEDGSIDPTSRLELLAVPSERRCCHEGGALAFASDGTLFVSTGDNTNPFESNGAAPLDGRPGRERYDSRRTAGNPHDLRGKILRINADGTVPDGNLFPRDGSLGRPEVFVMGVRNPFRIAAEPDRFGVYWGDVGPDGDTDTSRGPRGYDEVNLATSPGDYGWPFCIADNEPYVEVDFATGKTGKAFDCRARRAPVFAYDYFTPSIPALGTGVAPNGAFLGRTALAGAVYPTLTDAPFALPRRFSNTLVMMEWTRDILATVETDDSGRLRAVERLLGSEPFHRPVDVEAGPDGALYVLEYGSGFWGDNPDAALSRIEYAPRARLSPIARLSPSTTVGPPPLAVHFSAAASSAPPGESVATFQFSVDGEPVVASGPELDVVFDAPGAHRVSVQVTSSAGVVSMPISETIVVGNAPPTVVILSPDPGRRVTPGVPVSLVGQGHDLEDGAAACEELTWNISLGHNAHAHPAATLHGCEVSFVPDLGDHAGSPGLLFYAVELTYTDHGGANGEPPLTARRGLELELAIP